MAETLLIDGHNLIGKLPGLSLSDPEDEAKLVGLLKRYRARRRRPMVVVFDGAPAGSAGRSRELSGTGVDVVFARVGRTADGIIKERVRAARNPGQVTVVTSDTDVARVARACRAVVQDSETFAAALLRELAPGESLREVRDVALAPDEVAEWEELFRQGRPEE
jgi:predicted RNA-binding protein with PIN domain